MANATLTGPLRHVEVVDAPHVRVRKPSDLFGLVLAIVGIAVVLELSILAPGTAEGVTADVQSAVARFLLRSIQIPLTLLQATLFVLVPALVVIDRIQHRAFRQLLESIGAALSAAVLAWFAVEMLTEFPLPTLTAGLSVLVDEELVIAIPPFVAAISALQTTAGTRGHRRAIAWSWNLFWVAITIAVITGELTLPGAFVTVLLGRATGLAFRYAVGVLSERAYGATLVAGIRRTGLDPVRIVRIGEIREGALPRTELATCTAPIGHTEHGLELGPRDTPPDPVHEIPGAPRDDSPEAPETPRSRLLTAAPTEVDEVSEDTATIIARASDAGARALERSGQGRVYAVTDVAGQRWDVVVLDGDRQLIGTLASIWASLRMRGIERRTVSSLRLAAERASLMTYSARDAGLRTPGFVGVAEAADSVILVHEHLVDARRLSELPPEEVTDDLLADLWTQLRLAHAAGLAHRDLADDVILVHDEQIWILGWTNGEIAAPELTRRLDIAQLLALLAVQVGVERAVSSASQVLDTALLGAIASLLQPVALPPESRELRRERKAVLKGLRDALIELIPPAGEAEPVQLRRFSPRAVLTTTLAVVAVWLLLTSLNIDQLSSAVREANPMWAVVAFALGMLTYVGAAMSLMAFSPVRLKLWKTTQVQVASSIVALVAPAGVGPAALNLRYLNRNRVDTPLAVASVALMQVSQFVTTIGLLLLIAAMTGSSSVLQVPDVAVFVVVGVLVAVLGIALTVPGVRQWVWAKAAPTLRQVWPRVLWVIGQPQRLGAGALGNVLMTGGYIAAFAATLAAFGQQVPLTQLALIYLGGMALGSAVPTPGGLGTVELALSGGLAASGVPPALAASIAVLFRVLTFWGRVPFGWLAMRRLQQIKEL